MTTEAKNELSVRAKAKSAKVSCPLNPEADDAVLLKQVAMYYHQRLKQSPEALRYLESKGLGGMDLIRYHWLGYADGSLALLLPDANSEKGKTLRARLIQLCLLRKNGQEYFDGCVVVPLFDAKGRTQSFYGRMIRKGKVADLYSSASPRGFFNHLALRCKHVILCESVFDALTFYANDIRNVLTIYMSELPVDEPLYEALKDAHRVTLAYASSDAGEVATIRDIKRFGALGVDVWMISIPFGFGVNDYIRCRLKLPFIREVLDCSDDAILSQKILKALLGTAGVMGKEAAPIELCGECGRPKNRKNLR